jgi:hypothetical protein
LNDGHIQNLSNPFGFVPLSNFAPRDFGFVHHSIAILFHEVPNLSITIRNFFIAYTTLNPLDAFAAQLMLNGLLFFFLAEVRVREARGDRSYQSKSSGGGGRRGRPKAQRREQTADTRGWRAIHSPQRTSAMLLPVIHESGSRNKDVHTPASPGQSPRPQAGSLGRPQRRRRLALRRCLLTRLLREVVHEAAQ